MAKKRRTNKNQKQVANIANKFFQKKNPIYWLLGIIVLVLGAYFTDFDIRQFEFPKDQEARQRVISEQNFNKAKTELTKIYKAHPEQKEFYCGCDFSWEGRKGIVDLKSCGYKVRKNEVRANRIEWEHVMPAYAFGNQLQCWKNGGRENCKTQPNYSIQFNTMEGDMHNLQPAVGEVNADRSNFGFNEFTKTFNQYGQCQFATDFKNRQVQPRNEIKGMIARTYLYMADRYGLNLSKNEERLMSAWNKSYPVQKWECERNRIIESVQGNDNPFITQQCQALGL
ncbi:deoxyribonuclease [Ignatzschineria ureiclastica]|uniref:Deoxyribonuclease n=1 Tax=Ignatzschineria ureiclastica TaxID=472582 RepID=A0A2U2AEC5_9GAMM|nr:endonuclease [Ignatzschineria ureiclastica]PWD80909.1 deoxyribonuclease [Ignatzschineria ureiclastica]GGZ93952.1 endonuclease [Ignatzschineria ureiclastica]